MARVERFRKSKRAKKALLISPGAFCEAGLEKTRAHELCGSGAASEVSVGNSGHCRHGGGADGGKGSCGESG